MPTSIPTSLQCKSIGSKALESYEQIYNTESALIHSRLRASCSKFFAKIEYSKTIGPEPASSGSYGKTQTENRALFFSTFQF